MAFDTILFDLDGTLTDPKEGITKCCQYGLRFAGVESERALAAATEKFISRFAETEKLVLAGGKKMEDLSPEELDGYYNAAKKR